MVTLTIKINIQNSAPRPLLGPLSNTTFYYKFFLRFKKCIICLWFAYLNMNYKTLNLTIGPYQAVLTGSTWRAQAVRYRSAQKYVHLSWAPGTQFDMCSFIFGTRRQFKPLLIHCIWSWIIGILSNISGENYHYRIQMWWCYLQIPHVRRKYLGTY